MNQIEKAQLFRALHVAGQPLLLCNIWDVGSAKAVAASGAAAIATSSWAVAAAQGFGDGEQLPMEFAMDLAKRLSQAIALPVSVDFEGGYAAHGEQVGANVTRLLTTGVVGLNFEDQIVGGPGLYAIDQQSNRIAAARAAADALAIPAFINARTDVFLKAEAGADPAALVDQAIARAQAYHGAGADGFFLPGLTAPELIQRICRQVQLPVNIMACDGFSDVAMLAQLGVARISFGPAPYTGLMDELRQRSAALVG